MRLTAFMMAWWAFSISLFEGIPKWLGLVLLIFGVLVDVCRTYLTRKIARVNPVFFRDVREEDGIKYAKIESKEPMAVCYETTGGGHLICYSSQLEDDLTKEEFISCLEHEKAHALNMHHEKMCAKGMATAIVWGLILIPFTVAPWMTDRNTLALIALLAMIVGLAGSVLSLKELAQLSRDQEFEADSHCVDKKALFSALRKINLTNEGLPRGLFASHPSLKEREDFQSSEV